MKLNILSSLRILIVFSFFLPFLKTCEEDSLFSKKLSEEAMIDSSSVVFEEKTGDTLNLAEANQEIDTVNSISKENIGILKPLVKDSIGKLLLEPSYSGVASLSGVGIFIYTIERIINLKWKEVSYIDLVSLSFILSFIDLFYRNKKLHILSSISMFTFTIFIIFEEAYFFILFGYWVCLALMGVNIYLLYLKKQQTKPI